MSFDILQHPGVTSDRLMPVEPRSASLFCLALLADFCALATLVRISHPALIGFTERHG
jgi:hypothetical protein